MWPFSTIREARAGEKFWKSQAEEWKGIAASLAQYAPTPVCKRCGGTDLQADVAGYYHDALDWRGAPLVCVGKCRLSGG